MNCIKTFQKEAAHEFYKQLAFALVCSKGKGCATASATVSCSSNSVTLLHFILFSAYLWWWWPTHAFHQCQVQLVNLKLDLLGIFTVTFGVSNSVAASCGCAACRELLALWQAQAPA
jgi:hypothetical protein